MKPASRLTVEPTQWLWKGHIPSGAVTMIDGDPGLGKSQVGVDLCARISRGDKMPDGSRSGAQNPIAMMYNWEDPAELQKARLKAAGANLDNIYLMPQDGHRLQLPDDLIRLEREIYAVDPAVVILDPIGAMLKTTLSRPVIDGIADIGKRTGAAMIVVRHLTKAGGRNPLMGGGGASGAIGAARAGFLVTSDPDDKDRRIISSTKNNAVKSPPSLVFQINSRPVRVGNLRRNGSFLEWKGESVMTATELMASRMKTSVQREAERFLEDEMAHGPRLAKDLIESAESGPQISKTELKRARDKFHITSHKVGQRKGIHPAFWVWTSPGQERMVKDEMAMVTLWFEYVERHKQDKTFMKEVMKEVV